MKAAVYKLEAVYEAKPRSRATVCVTDHRGQQGHFMVQFEQSGEIASVRHIGAGSVGRFGRGSSFRRPGPHLMDLIRQAAQRARIDRDAVS